MSTSNEHERHTRATSTSDTHPVDTILISIRGVDSVHIPWTTHIPWVISRGKHVISRGQHVISRGYAPWTTPLPWVTPVENTYPVGTISRGLHVPTGYKVLSTGYDIPWVISRGLNKFNRWSTVRLFCLNLLGTDKPYYSPSFL